VILSLTVISTSAFNLECSDPQSRPVSGIGVTAYATRAGALGDVRLFARTLNSAVIVQVSQSGASGEERVELAQQFASKALDRLDAVQEATKSEAQR
jgi:hypothetical protein